MLHLAVVGKDVSQSDSTSMNTFILQKLGAKGSYERVSVPPEQFMERAEELYKGAADRMFRFLKVGMQMKKDE